MTNLPDCPVCGAKVEIADKISSELPLPTTKTGVDIARDALFDALFGMMALAADNGFRQITIRPNAHVWPLYNDFLAAIKEGL